MLERLADLPQLAGALLAAEVDRGADAGRPHLPGALGAREWNLVELVGVGQQLVVVELDDERDPVRVPARHGAENAERRGDGVAATLDRELDDLLGVEIRRVWSEAGAGAVLDPLVDRQDAHIAGSGEATVLEQPPQVANRRRASVAVEQHAFDEVRAGQMQQRSINRLAAMIQELIGISPKQIGYVVERRLGGACHQCLPFAIKSS